MKRVKVDFGATVRGGMIRASRKRTVGGTILNVGDPVIAYDPDEQLEYAGTVEEVTPDGRFAYLRMAWHESQEQMTPAAAHCNAFLAVANLFVDGFGTDAGVRVLNVQPTLADCLAIEPPPSPIGFHRHLIDREPGQSSYSRFSRLADIDAT